MNMDHLIGQRFSLISKSEIRYVGTLHQINPEEATIALEDVLSYGTESRRVENFVPPSQQKFDFIVFRGSDVKDIKVVEEEESKQPTPPNVPNDPAILNSSRPGPQGPPPQQGPPQDRRESPYPPPGYPQQYGYPPHYPQQFGRGYGPPPPGAFGPGPGFPPYGGPPPPGYFGPPGQGFPGQGQFQGPPPPQPIGPPGHRNGPPPPQDVQPPGPPQGTQPTSELPVDNKSTSQPDMKNTPPPPAEAKAPAQGPPSAPTGPRAAPTQPKGKVAPAVPFTVNQKSFTPPVQTEAAAAQPAAKPSQTKAEMDAATLKAKQAVQEALAKLPGSNAPKPAPLPTAASIDTLAQKMSEMGPTTNGTARGRGGNRGSRGSLPRGGSNAQAGRKIEIPKSDYDFESANKKFNKEDLIKEAIASGSPAGEDTPNDGIEEPTSDGLERSNSNAATTKAYNKSTSFFDNISSEARDREENTDARPHARHTRADEFKKNVDTFGQGNVDGGYRGRGRGGYRGRQYGGNRGYRGGYNRGYGGRGGRGAQGQAQADPQAPPAIQS
ncbi:uncharacterized protein HMPREF1541_08900 [Cyphellophora europaea CBS 101466]|uniref:DFDF domain-containing protein n=1 Tax=Cyphellophora europaea (strain CBS 101466) TaxID=1220924 RepID=W2RJF3_CYPE1|nr:uncharacterized protein HMPREF1541_08900 [Cyphellophora europaea CBS 101466]ETN36622.1 hypothetical protein HMPREF1541_08900 [Cyphellophora europaea CBS 101466]